MRQLFREALSAAENPSCSSHLNRRANTSPGKITNKQTDLESLARGHSGKTIPNNYKSLQADMYINNEHKKNEEVRPHPRRQHAGHDPRGVEYAEQRAVLPAYLFA